MILATFIFTGMSVGVKKVSNNVPIFEIILARGLCGAVITVLVSRAVGLSPLFGHPRRSHLMLMRALFGTSAMGMSYFALMYLPLHDYTALFFANPVFTVVLAWLVLGERATWITLLGIVVALAGIPVVCQPPILFGGEWEKQYGIGVGLAIGASVLASGKYTLAYIIE